MSCSSISVTQKFYTDVLLSKDLAYNLLIVILLKIRLVNKVNNYISKNKYIQ